MSGIGISPCPPFNRRNLVPGVLYDGNTAAWYKHNDPIGCVYDGANRVSVWKDKLNYSASPSFFPMPMNFMDAAWTIAGTAVKVDNDSYTSAAAADGLRNVNLLWTAARYYRLRIRINITAGQLFILGDWNNANTYWNYTGTGAFENIDVTIYCNAIGINGLWFRNSGAANVDIEYCYIEMLNGNNLYQITAGNQPTYNAANGVLFDGVNDYLKALPFVFVQPEMIYFVGRQITWLNQDGIFDGNLVQGLFYQNGVSPAVSIYGGVAFGADINMILNTFVIVRVLFNGLNSSLQINNNAVAIGNAGASNMSGFTLGARATPAQYSNVQVKEIILRRIADNAATQTSIYNYLKIVNAVP